MTLYTTTVKISQKLPSGHSSFTERKVINWIETTAGKNLVPEPYPYASTSRLPLHLHQSFTYIIVEKNHKLAQCMRNLSMSKYLLKVDPQSLFTYSKSVMETAEQCVKSIKS